MEVSKSLRSLSILESLNPEEERKTKGKAEPKRLELRMFRGMFRGTRNDINDIDGFWHGDEVHLRPQRHPHRRPAAKAKKARHRKTWQDLHATLRAL